VLAATALLTTALLVAGAHWLTDVVGGLLVSLAVLTGGSRTALRLRAHRQVRTPEQEARDTSRGAVIDR
jgi:membrane-associated phospholipid phosphatase